jgi:y4mF family transcriptional regulator
VSDLAVHQIKTVADLGILVRAARRRLHLSQQRFADLAGVGRRFVSELECGKSTLEADLVLNCCLAAGIDILARPRNQ